MKGEFARILLESMGGAAVASADLLEAFLSAGYGASYGKLSRELRGVERRREEKARAAEAEWRLRQRYYNILSWLRRDGFVVENKKGMFRMTLLGKRKLEFLKERSASALPRTTYAAASASRVVIVMFDVPEKERAKRNWLRSVLKNMGLRMIQKSVWLGKIKIPKEFLDDVRNLRLVECVEIFEVGKSGTLTHVL